MSSNHKFGPYDTHATISTIQIKDSEKHETITKQHHTIETDQIDTRINLYRCSSGRNRMPTEKIDWT